MRYLYMINQRGQVMITMLYIMVIGTLITTGAAFALIANTQAASAIEVGEITLGVAESGIENAILKLIRNPAYTGETLVLSEGRTALVTVSTSSGIVITSSGVVGRSRKTIQAKVRYNDGVLTIDSWNEL